MSTETTINRDKMVCHCLKVRESKIRRQLDTGEAISVSCIKQQTGAGTGCTACIRRISNMIKEDYPSAPSPICMAR